MTNSMKMMIVSNYHAFVNSKIHMHTINDTVANAFLFCAPLYVQMLPPCTISIFLHFRLTKQFWLHQACAQQSSLNAGVWKCCRYIFVHLQSVFTFTIEIATQYTYTALFCCVVHVSSHFLFVDVAVKPKTKKRKKSSKGTKQPAATLPGNFYRLHFT